MSSTNFPIDSADPLLNQITHFSRVIAGSETPLVSGKEGFETLRVIEAIQSSAATGQTVKL